MDEGQEEQPPTAKRYVTLSFVLHATLFLLLGVGSFFTAKPMLYTPSVQIDMVALPDRLKNANAEPVDTSLPVKSDPVPAAPEQKEAARPAPRPKAEHSASPKPEPKATDQMALARQQKAAERRAEEALKKMREQLREERRVEEEKRLATLSKRKEDLKRFEQTYRNALRGNQKNDGSSASGEMQAVINAYAGHVTDRIRSNWALPSFLQSQALNAKMVIHLDARGNVVKMEFTKVSGNSLFDNNVEEAVRRSSPFLPPPAEMASGLRNSGIEVKFPL